ncbi:MAG: ABC transporter permease [Candidatus Tectomicrobia bacterium]|uniref:ABC transporter permease n=1 Tax=Tectimicrobiota bacterium TaxID=2528274 RepID=A0A937VZK6_UNCTE|nr:ABC transporter permease [Candidatus Tectomicrobia bacterium]
MRLFPYLQLNSLARKLWRDLWHLRGQALAVALVVACGMASFTTTRSTYESLKTSQEAYYERYRFAHIFASLKRAPEALTAQLEALPDVARVHTRVVVSVTLDVPGLREPATGRLISIPEAPQPILNDLYIRRGRWIEPGRRDEVLVSEAFATANRLDLGDTLGAVLNGRWERLRIVGIALSPEYIYEISGFGAFPDNKRFGVLWMGRGALAAAFNMEGAFNDVVFTLLRGGQEAEIIFQLDRLLARYGGLGAYGRYHHPSHRFLSDEMVSLKANATIAPAIFLGIAAFLLHVVLSRLISTQRDQIAILKAFGYSPLVIGKHYGYFVLAIVCIGAIFGAAAGLWLGAGLTQNYGRFFRFPVLLYEARPSLMVTALLVSGGAAIVGALGAVRRAVALPPAEAMRPEPPARFQRTVLERLGLQRLLSPVGRMILRNLERKPLQTLLAILGIAMAVAILILGGYFEDALQYIMDVHFRQAQREDVTVTFREPRAVHAWHAVRSLPGVLQAEPFRRVAARLRAGHRTHRTALTGLTPDGALRRLVDRHMHVVTLPPEGVVLTAKLAEILGVAPGDRLTVEVLEGTRATHQVAVVGLVDELIGATAYIDIAALNRLLHEGETLSGAYLVIDPQASADLNALLKRVPAVAGVSFRKTMLQSFETTVAENLRGFVRILVVFASVITFSVVYNAARIALSERGRELASLRVMGFTRREIAVILLGEQAILTLAALPLGFVLGYWVCSLMPLAYDSELFRMPVVVSRATYGMACLVITVSALLSSLIVRRRLDHLDLIAVLKTRE